MTEEKAAVRVNELIDRRSHLVTQITHGIHSKAQKSQMVAEVRRLTAVLNLK